MQNNLYFICPTDHLETVISSAFQQENYYVTSLGNSITFDTHTVRDLNELLVVKDIHEIFFVLSNDNHIVLNGSRKKDFQETTRLDGFYNQLIKQREDSSLLWETGSHEVLILSDHLNNKIKEFRLGVKNLFIDQIKITGKIYNRQENTFSDIYPDWMSMKHFNLN